MSASGEGGLAPLAFNGALEMEGSPHKLAALAGHKLATPAAKDDLRFRTMGALYRQCPESQPDAFAT